MLLKITGANAIAFLWLAWAVPVWPGLVAADEPVGLAAKAIDPHFDGELDSSVTAGEAHFRARVLHETLRGTLQVMHRDFFDEDNANAIPSASLEDVFHALGDEFGIKVKWLNVETDVVNVDHEPADAFERQAARALIDGKPSHYQVARPASSRTESGNSGDPSVFRYVGAIKLRSQCLKCHVKRRTDNQDRVAGLSLSIPMAKSRKKQSTE